MWARPHSLPRCCRIHGSTAAEGRSTRPQRADVSPLLPGTDQQPHAVCRLPAGGCGQLLGEWVGPRALSVAQAGLSLAILWSFEAGSQRTRRIPKFQEPSCFRPELGIFIWVLGFNSGPQACVTSTFLSSLPKSVSVPATFESGDITCHNYLFKDNMWASQLLHPTGGRALTGLSSSKLGD